MGIAEVSMRSHPAVGFVWMALLAMSAGCGSSGDDSAPPEAPGSGGSAGSDAGTGGTTDASVADGKAGQEAAAGSSSPDSGTGGAPPDANPPADTGTGGAPSDTGTGGAPPDTGTGGALPDAKPPADDGTGGAAVDAADATSLDAAEASPPAGLGCGTTPRVGFTSITDWPTVAACGSPTGYSEAVTGGASTCATGWHMCTLSDVGALTGYPPDFVVPTGGDPDIGAWLAYTDTATGNFAQYYVACGGTLWKTADLQGTGPCSVTGNYPDGYRLRVSTQTWGGTHDTTLGCISHADHACGYSGGAVPLAPQYTLCCQDN
jgi:hypothetical protein